MQSSNDRDLYIVKQYNSKMFLKKMTSKYINKLIR